MKKHYDAIIIGAGAAGLMCGVEAAKRGRKVLIIEHNKKVGEKIRISGGGRCNFTNIHTNSENFLSKNERFSVSALKRFSADDFIKMVQKYNISFHEKTLGQLFCDFSASEIIDMFLNELAKNNAKLSTKTCALNIEKDDVNFSLTLHRQENETKYPQLESDLFLENDNVNITCESLIIASGGLSIEKMGASSFGYEVAKKFGLKVIQTSPALVGLRVEESSLQDFRNLAGISFYSKVSAINKYSDKLAKKPKKISFCEAVLFTHRGLSGPAILQISSYVNMGEEIEIDMIPNVDIYQVFLDEKIKNPKVEIAKILNNYLPKRLVSFILEKNGIVGFVADLSNKKLKELAQNINFYKVKITDNDGYKKAEVTLGGVDVDEISSKDFEAKKIKRLYFIGEVLDVTGHLGGYNFQFAWASGFAAGQVI